jgi:hypothetical protein
MRAETRDWFWYAPDGSVVMQAWVTTVWPADGPEPERHQQLTDEQAEELRRRLRAELLAGQENLPTAAHQPPPEDGGLLRDTAREAQGVTLKPPSPVPTPSIRFG